MKVKRILNLIIYVVIGSLSNGYGQQTDEVWPDPYIDRLRFESLSEELDYSKTKKRWLLKELDSEQTSDRRRPSLVLGGGVFQLVAYVIIIGLVGAIIFIIFSGVKAEERVEVKELDLKEMEHLEEVDAMSGYLEAVKNGDYRLAVRMQFILILQKLSDANLILWRPEKTNKDYLNELRGSFSFASFKELTHIYEWVWYGNTKLHIDDFRRFDEKFSHFKLGET